MCGVSHGALRICRVTCRDIEGIEHSVEVTAEGLYEAVARGLVSFRNADCAGVLRTGLTRITVVPSDRKSSNTVRMRDFKAWLESNGRSPAEMALKSRLRGLLGK